MNRTITRIYYADDDEDDHDLFDAAMRGAFPDIQVTHFISCDELLKYAEDHLHELPDIIFLDLNMRGNDGCECLEQLKAESRAHAIPVVIYSTADDPFGIRKAMECGAYTYIVKPLRIADMQENFRKLFRDLK